MKVGTRLTEDKLWNVRKTCVSGQQLRCLPAQRGWKALLEINNINLQLPVNYIINRRNRRASDYLQVDQRDRQTQWGVEIGSLALFPGHVDRMSPLRRDGSSASQKCTPSYRNYRCDSCSRAEDSKGFVGYLI